MRVVYLFFALIIGINTVYGQNRSDQEALQIANDVLSKMTLSEKALLLHGDHIFSFPGIKRLGIPVFYPIDGPCSVRPELSDGGRYIHVGDTVDCATAFPTLSALSATWDADLAFQFGNAISNEFRARGKDMYLGPGVNIVRTPLCGRNFEYMGEDPFLTSSISTPIIQGVQQNNVAACIKHFALNNQELDRFAVNVTASERALHEIYFPAFETAVKKGGALSLMGGYNKFNGDWCCESEFLLNKTLKQDWGFKGVVISDWGAIHSMTKAMKAGCDLESNFSREYLNIQKAVNEGTLPVSLVDEKVRRVLWMYAKLRMIGPDAEKRVKGELRTEKHKLLARKIAEESIVLLKNQGHILPLDKNKISKLLIVGKVADSRLTIDINAKAVNDLLGGGSGEAKPLYEITPLEGIRHYLSASSQVEYIANPENYKDADFVKKVKNVDAVLVFTGNTHEQEHEGEDRKDILLPKGQDEMVRAILAIRPRAVIINQSGAPVAMPWEKKAKAIVQNWFNGQENGNALARVIFGEVNPSGKLSCTFPKQLSDVACHSLDAYKSKSENYIEDILVGYRWFDKQGINPLFAFGHGLSYAKFKFGKIKITQLAEGDSIKVVVPVTNQSNRTGTEVVQLYISEISPSVLRPNQELKGFQRIQLAAHETKEVALNLSTRDFSYWSEIEHGWKYNSGNYEIRVGASSRDIRVSKEITLKENFNLLQANELK
ncbi:glycoside hydrolase family 3 C-terminal domain-containing protein [Solitalea lacus]|uniref:glycoside hydrolase family 3 C-terminal domain-containing protein n=1 Tax=Solitalea lacus TaxID=2911172 RepID=UPI001ED9FD71|nr:glycoside hydrolase family 3 C-terminal domain-containing protein [Solitalea lacus]UKJ06736.1 glycoside hydrolase family 3 C-terminal domain-containing protein [Solitalea lacus]